MSDLPFERQQGESPKAFAAFVVYRDIGPTRSQEEVSRRLAKSRQVISRWSARYNWVERARMYDRAIDAKARRQAEQKAAREREQMFYRHAEQSRGLQDMANIVLQEFKRRLGGDQIEYLPGDDLIKLVQLLPKTVDVAQKLERLAVGEPLDNLDPPKPIEQMTDEELDAYIRQLQHTAV